MDVQHWVRTASRTLQYLVGAPTPLIPPALPGPVSWWAAARSSVLFVSLATVLQGVWLACDDPLVRPLDLHGTAWVAGVTGVEMALVVLVLAPSGKPSPIRFAWPAVVTGAVGVYICARLGLWIIDPGWSLWVQLGVAGVIDLPAIAVAVAVTHLPARSPSQAPPDAAAP